jgi:hypothetical protein
MFFESKNPAVVKTNALKNSVAVQKTVIEHGNFRLRFRDEFAVEINRQFARRGGRRLLLCVDRRLDRGFRHRFVDYRSTSCRGFC